MGQCHPDPHNDPGTLLGSGIEAFGALKVAPTLFLDNPLSGRSSGSIHLGIPDGLEGHLWQQTLLD